MSIKAMRCFGPCLALLAASFAPFAPAQAQLTSWHGLTAVLPASTTIYQYAISPNSQFVVFTADIEVHGRFELYSVPITGSVPVKLNPPLVAGGGEVNDFDFQIAPDSSRVIYRTDQEVDNRQELYSVPIEGGQATKLNGPMVSGGDVGSYKLDANTGRVVYIADQQSNDVFELFSVPIEGGAFVKLNPTLVLGGDLSSFQIDPASDRVVYSADQDTNDLYELFSVPIAGGMSVKLNPPVSKGIYDFQIAPGIPYVMFRATQAGASAVQLYGNDTTGGMAQRRNLDLSPGENVLGFRISPTAAQVVYNVGANNQFAKGDLYRTSPYSGTYQILTVADPGFGVGYNDFVFTPDGQRIVCTYQLNAAAPVKLQSVKTTGFPVSHADLFVPNAGHSVGTYRISPDSQWVVYEDYFSFSSSYLSAIPTAGGASVPIGQGTRPAITPDSQRVIYRYPPAGDYSDVLSTQIFGGGERNLSRVGSLDYAYGAQISPDGQWIVFGVQLNDTNGTIGYQLRVSDGTEAPLVFNLYLPAVQR